MPLVVQHVHSTLRAACPPPCASASGAVAPQLYWGSMEIFHWHAGIHRPVGFGGAGVGLRRDPVSLRPKRVHFTPCRERPAPALPGRHSRVLPKQWESTAWREGADGIWTDRSSASAGNVSGPFFFAKGPLYLLARQLVRQVRSSERVRAEYRAALQSGAHAGFEPTWPWEDVFLGWAVAAVAAGDGLVALHAGSDASIVEFSRAPSRGRPGLLLRHPFKARPEEMVAVERRSAAQRSCATSTFVDQLRCYEYRACSGARWQGCQSMRGSTMARRRAAEQRANTNCSR